MLISESIKQLIQESDIDLSKFEKYGLNFYIRITKSNKDIPLAIKQLLDYGKTCKNYVPIVYFIKCKPSKQMEKLIKDNNIYIIIETDSITYDDQQYNAIIKDAKAKYKLS